MHINRHFLFVVGAPALLVAVIVVAGIYRHTATQTTSDIRASEYPRQLSQAPRENGSVSSLEEREQNENPAPPVPPESNQDTEQGIAVGEPNPNAPQPNVGSGCVVGGCSSQLCVDATLGDVMSTCEWREEYACYQTATCERQADGQCGWTETQELKECRAGAQTEAPVFIVQ